MDQIVNCSLVGNHFRINIDGGAGKIKYPSALFLEMSFSETNLILTDLSSDRQSRSKVNPVTIIRMDLFRYNGAPYATEALISDLLKDKIGSK
jgi:hypothetical protein